MNYFTRVITNGFLVEVQIATDPHPGAGYISARKLKYDRTGEMPMPFATVWINVGFNRDMSLDEVDDIKRWLTEATKMARRLDEVVTDPADFTEAVSYEVRQVTGDVLILDKKVRESNE